MTDTEHPEPADQWPDPADVPVHVAWSNVMRDVAFVPKGDRNEHFDFMFRGIDAMTKAFGPACRRHGVVVIPTDHTTERYWREHTTSRGRTTLQQVVTTSVRWAIIGPQGDRLEVATAGECVAEDDKAGAKAWSVAQRELWIRAGSVPTGDPDPDASSPDMSMPTPGEPVLAYHPADWLWVALRTLPPQAGPAGLEAAYLERVGKKVPTKGRELDNAVQLVGTYVQRARDGEWGEWDDSHLQAIEAGANAHAVREAVLADMAGEPEPEPTDPEAAEPEPEAEPATS